MIDREALYEPLPSRAVELPTGWRIERIDGGLRIRLRESREGRVAVLLFAVVWNLFTAALVSADYGSSVGPGVFVGVASFALVGVFLAYVAVVPIVKPDSDAKAVVIADGTLSLVDAMPGSRLGRSLPIAEVEQLFVVEKRRGDRSRWDLFVLHRDGHGREWVSDLASEEQARYLEVTIEDELGIPDVAIDGEHRP